MTTLTRTQTIYIQKLGTESGKMAQELQMMQDNASDIPNSLRDDYKENLRQLKAAHLAIQNKLNTWRNMEGGNWMEARKQMDHHMNVYHQTLSNTLNMVRDHHEAESLGWVEGMAKNVQARSEGWTQGMGDTADDSEGWTEGMGDTAKDSEGWTEGMTEKATA